MSELILYVGKPGSGKSTHYGNNFTDSHVHASQDLQTEEQRKEIFEKMISQNKNVVVDHQTHLRSQREYYLRLARENGYHTKIIELKVNKHLCEYHIANRDCPPAEKLASMELLKKYSKEKLL